MSGIDAVGTASALALISDVAVRLASGETLEERLHAVLETARGTLHARACAIWIHSAEGLTRTISAGDSSSLPDASAAILSMLDNGAGSHGALVVRRLVAGSRRLGALTLETDEPLGGDQDLVLSTLANLLAPVLAHEEQLRQLEGEVEVRTRQIDEERRFTEKIIDSLPVGLYVIDREYRVQAWNRKRETGMQGISREEALGRTIFEILHRQPAELLRREFDDVLRSGRIQQFNMESRATGEVRTFRISKIPMRLNDAATTHVITIGEDVTEWRDAQDRFAQAEKLAAIGQLAAGVMHEVNNPLATIAACAESLALRHDDLRAAGCDVPAQAAEYLRIIDNEIHRCKRIVDGLLDFARPKPLVKARTDINAVVEQTLFLLKHHARFKKFPVHTLFDPSLDQVLANPEQLVQVFMALLMNAADSLREDGTITVRTRRGISSEEAVIAEVMDEGSGIARGDLPKIFEPFYTTKAPGRGTGLGLSICYGIIDEHGGRIEVDSTFGTGSTFRVLLPSAESHA